LYRRLLDSEVVHAAAILKLFEI
jgi:hypothetical protein